MNDAAKDAIDKAKAELSQYSYRPTASPIVWLLYRKLPGVKPYFIGEVHGPEREAKRRVARMNRGVR